MISYVVDLVVESNVTRTEDMKISFSSLRDEKELF
jgi:hypothetical protein